MPTFKNNAGRFICNSIAIRNYLISHYKNIPADQKEVLVVCKDGNFSMDSSEVSIPVSESVDFEMTYSKSQIMRLIRILTELEEQPFTAFWDQWITVQSIII